MSDIDPIAAILTILALILAFFAGYQSSASIQHKRQVEACLSHGHGWGPLSNLATDTKGDLVDVCVIRDEVAR